MSAAARALRLGVSFDGGDPPDVLRGIVETADAAGVANLWIASHLFHREPIACAAATLAARRAIGVVLMAMSPYTVHPVHAAMAAATLDEYFPGRVQLCFGMGAPRDLEAAGVSADRPLATLRETLQLARLLLAGATVEFAGECYRVSGRRLVMGAHPLPLWLAASGPQMLELAGELADGIVISAGASPEFIRWSLDHVQRGESKSGRTIRKAALVFCSVDADARIANDRLRRRLGYVLRGKHHRRNLDLAGTRLDQAALVRAFAQEDWAVVNALIDDEVLRRHGASGTAEQALEALAKFQMAGLDEIVAYGVQERAHVRRVLAIMQSPASIAQSDGR